MTQNSLDSFRKLTLQLHDQYRSVVDSVAAIQSETSPATISEDLQTINDLFNEVKQTEAELQPVRQAVQAAGHSVPEDLKPIVAKTVEMVSTLLPVIEQLEAVATESRDQLAPKIHSNVQALNMQQAYQRSKS